MGVENEETDDRYAALEAAFDAAQAPANEDAEAPANDNVEQQAEAAADVGDDAVSDSLDETAAEARARDEKGRFAPKEKTSKTAAPAQGAASPPTQPRAGAATSTVAPPVPGVQATTGPAAAITETLKAPQSWRPDERELWAKVPAEVQRVIDRREREAAEAVRDSRPAKEFHGQFQQMLAPYAGLLASQGAQPLQAIGSLLQTSAALHMAPPVQKAQLVAQLIKNFGVPIDALDAALSGQAPTQTPGQQQSVDPTAIAQQVRQQLMTEMQQQRQQAEAQKHQAALAKFAETHEFLDDLREPMSKLLEAGLANDFEDAYNKAASLDPHVSKVLQQRAEAQRANASQASTQRAKAAASSVRSQPASAPARVDPDDRRAQLEAEWNARMGR